MKTGTWIVVAAIAATATVPAAASASGNHGKVGQTVTVKGQSRDIVAVSVTKIQDPLLAYGAPGGMRVIGVVFTVKNVGKVKYDDSPSAFLSTADGQISGGLITGGGPCNTPGDIKLAPGQTKTFCIPFNVGRTSKLAFIQYNTDSGYGTPAVFAAR
jgi:hypothetical protein